VAPLPLPSTQAVVDAVRAAAARRGRTVGLDEEIGGDITGAGPDDTGAEDISFFSHEAHLEVSGVPAVTVAVRPGAELVVGVDGVELDVPRDRVVDVLEAVWGGRAWVSHPAAPQLHVAVPGDETYREVVLVWTPWLMSVTRTPSSRLGALWRRLIGRRDHLER
jgi:hypothetical protein